jgi:hypothetical protein
VEHPCYQCGASVEDGIPFCPKCAAPQIRVALAGAAGTPAEAVGAAAAAYASHVPPFEIDWRRALPASLQAGLIAAILMIIPLGASFGLGMLAAGFLAVIFYRRRMPGSNLRPGKGAQLGAASGALGFVIYGIFTAVETMLRGTGNEVRKALVAAVEQAAARNPDPQAQQMMQYLKTPAGLTLVMILGLMVMFCLFVVVSSLGGALGAAMLRRKDQH